jgi:hypothetical protein
VLVLVRSHFLPIRETQLLGYTAAVGRLQQEERKQREDNLQVEVGSHLVQAESCSPEVVGMRLEGRHQLAEVGIHSEDSHHAVEAGNLQVAVAGSPAVVDNRDSQLEEGNQQGGSQLVDIQPVVDIRTADILVVREEGMRPEGIQPAAAGVDVGAWIYLLR